jgi:hypothetical protein
MSQAWWEELTLALKIVEPHSLEDIKVASHRSQMHVDTLRKMNLNWIDLRFIFFLLFLTTSWKSTSETHMNMEKKRWSVVERKVRYHSIFHHTR